MISSKACVEERTKHERRRTCGKEGKTGRGFEACCVGAFGFGADLRVGPLQAFAASSLHIEGSDYDWVEGGHSGNGWNWSGAENLLLNGYNGGVIAAAGGNLDVVLAGSNTVQTAPDEAGTYDAGLSVDQGNLSISGQKDASLKIEGANAGISVDSGSITIDGVKVEAEAADDTDTSASYGIVAGGDINIINGAHVEAEANGTFSSAGIFASNGNILIKDSVVEAESTAAPEKGVGILALGKDRPVSIIIDRSTVNAHGLMASILALSNKEGSFIKLIDSKIVDPEDARIQDVVIKDEGMSGQTIGLGKHVIESLSDKSIVKNVTIKLDVDDSDSDQKQLPKTADNMTSQTELLIVLAMGGFSLLGAALHFARRNAVK